MCWFNRERPKSLDESSEDQGQAQPATHPTPSFEAVSSGSPADLGSFPGTTSVHKLMPVSRHSRRRRGKLPAGLSLAPAARTYGRTAAPPAPAGEPSSPPSWSPAPLLRMRRGTHSAHRDRSEHREAETTFAGKVGRERHRRRASRCPRAEPQPARQARPAALPEPSHKVTAGVPAAKQKMEQERRAPRRGRAGKGRAAACGRAGVARRELRSERGFRLSASRRQPVTALRAEPGTRLRPHRAGRGDTGKGGGSPFIFGSTTGQGRSRPRPRRGLLTLLFTSTALHSRYRRV